jgi:hypothetical protein
MDRNEIMKQGFDILHIGKYSAPQRKAPRACTENGEIM